MKKILQIFPAWKILFYLLFVVLLVACTDSPVLRKTQSYATLKVAVPVELLKYIDSPRLLLHPSDSSYYDSASSQTIFVFDSIRTGPTTITAFSLLTDDLEQKVNLKWDTLIAFNAARLKQFTNENPQNFPDSILLMNGDSLHIGQELRGCFGGSVQKLVICKDGSNYKVLFRIAPARQLAKSKIIPGYQAEKYIAHFFKEAKKLFPNDENSGMWRQVNISTTSIFIYIRKGNSVYALPDVGGLEWQGFFALKEQLGLPVPTY